MCYALKTQKIIRDTHAYIWEKAILPGPDARLDTYGPPTVVLYLLVGRLWKYGDAVDGEVIAGCRDVVEALFLETVGGDGNHHPDGVGGVQGVRTVKIDGVEA